jgi:hypothetical protein
MLELTTYTSLVWVLQQPSQTAEYPALLKQVACESGPALVVPSSTCRRSLAILARQLKANFNGWRSGDHAAQVADEVTEVDMIRIIAPTEPLFAAVWASDGKFVNFAKRYILAYITAGAFKFDALNIYRFDQDSFFLCHFLSEVAL